MGYSGDVTGRDLDVCVSNLFASSWNRGNLDAKIHQFCQLQEKKNPERLFPLQNVFCFTLPNASEGFFEGLFPFQNVRRVPSGPKIDLCWVWFGLKNYPLVNKQKAIEHGHL